MFRLSQSTRRRLFRTGFLLVCVLPLVALVIVGWRQRVLSHVQAHELALRQVLGMRVRIGQVIHPSPGVVRYVDVQLDEVETSFAVASCDVVEFHASSGAGRPAELVLRGVTVEDGATGALYQTVDQLLRGEYLGGELYVTLSADVIEFRGTTPCPQLKGVNGAIRSTDQAAEARFEFHAVPPLLESAAAQLTATQATGDPNAPAPLPTGPETASAESAGLLRIVRNRKEGAVIEGFEINTGAAAIPCETLTPLVGCELTYLAGSRFQGTVKASQQAEGWWADVRGGLLGVDLQQLIGDRFGHKIEGAADVMIQTCRCENGRVSEADLTIAGGHGSVSRSLLSAAADAMPLGQRWGPTPGVQMLPYKQLAAAVRMSQHGEFEIAGRCTLAGGRPTDVILMSPDERALWRQPPRNAQPLPVSALLRALVAADGPIAPANSKIAWLMGKLPIEATARRDPPSAPVTQQNLLREAPPEPTRPPRRVLPGPD